jgi:hypothetical protein
MCKCSIELHRLFPTHLTFQASSLLVCSKRIPMTSEAPVAPIKLTGKSKSKTCSIFLPILTMGSYKSNKTGYPHIRISIASHCLFYNGDEEVVIVAIVLGRIINGWLSCNRSTEPPIPGCGCWSKRDTAKRSKTLRILDAS